MGNLSALGNTVVQTTPVGVIEAFAGVNAPAGWLFCDGSAISRVQYPELFSALSTTYGSGDGSTTFNIPDLRGRMPFGKGTHVDVATLGNNEGSSLANRRPKHQHTVYDAGHTHTNRMNGGLQVYRANVAAGSGEYGITSANTGSIVDNSTNTTGVRVNPEGAASSTSPTDAPPYLVVNYIIKAVADLPRAGWTFQQNAPVVTQLPSNPAIGDEVYHLISSNIYHKRWDGTQWQSVANDLIADQVTFDKIATSQTNWAQNTPTVTTVNTTTPTVIATTTITLRGRGPVLVIGTGDGNPSALNDWNYIAIYINGNQQTPYIVCVGPQASGNNPFAITRMFSGLSAGSNTFTLRAWQGQGTMVYGEVGTVNAPSLVVVELI